MSAKRNYLTCLILSLALTALVSCDKEKASEADDDDVSVSVSFSRGADISWCTEMEAEGRTFHTSAGDQQDIFALMKEIGMTAVRLRVWVNPQKYGYGPWCDITDVVNKAKRAARIGLDVMIDFHYSDFFADPISENRPMEWQAYDFQELKQAVAEHTGDVLWSLKKAGVSPRWVQVGNETNSGMLYPAGKIEWDKTGPARFANYVELSNAGYWAVKNVFPEALVIIHLGGTENPRWFFPDFREAGGKFDMIGVSHYPTEQEWDSANASATHSNINAAIWVKDMAKDFGVPVMLVETGFDVHRPELASVIMKDLFSRMEAIPECKGIFYWEPEVDGVWKPAFYNSLGWGAYGMGAFTTSGAPTHALDAFGHNQEW
ncbi:MAG: glycosyl hydrolase 53 family protein [Bacteroidales bacterium]|nr:glycosyl hydrolase 53 family protein [Bacteroidales bacterium]